MLGLTTCSLTIIVPVNLYNSLTCYLHYLNKMKNYEQQVKKESSLLYLKQEIIAVSQRKRREYFNCS